MFQPVKKEFFHQPTIELAKQLLGTVLVKETKEGVAAGRIVETEAYLGPDDRAAHSFKGRRTKRTEAMFHEPGTVYTYVMHTHCLVNVVSGKVDMPEAVLIRAVEPVYGKDLMYERRGEKKRLYDLTSGPGKLTKALGITRDDYGRRFYEQPIYIAADTRHDFDISVGPRVGIDNSGEARDYPWRFWVKDNPFVSKPRKEVDVIKEGADRL
ncbi:DNA-3-methyladenine glycosylase [Alteribacter aurantiacus]|uniref:DNA-3-methyladenine glycosylase n=1 Tax=Alteribacter aurantiacus TaxID=254410 RepID=UPI00042033FF|nr:DNA-3-methyladenine glycosylase [Alteribacter aurantiacus]